MAVYVPCISALAAMIKEFGQATTIKISMLSVGVAGVLGMLSYGIGSMLGY